MVNNRTFSHYADALVKENLQTLLASTTNPERFKQTMNRLGVLLGDVVKKQITHDDARCLVVSTAEDADYLSNGVRDVLSESFNTLTAVFWNNHYSSLNGSMAPIVHKYLQSGYEMSDTLVVVKSVVSGSCVVRTNILALIENINVKNIYIVSPVMHIYAADNLKKEFPPEIADKFVFVYFAQDAVRDEFGEVKPGIGGQVYNLLGLSDQPVKVDYMPELVKQLAFA